MFRFVLAAIFVGSFIFGCTSKKEAPRAQSQGVKTKVQPAPPVEVIDTIAPRPPVIEGNPTTQTKAEAYEVLCNIPEKLIASGSSETGAVDIGTHLHRSLINQDVRDFLYTVDDANKLVSQIRSAGLNPSQCALLKFLNGKTPSEVFQKDDQH